MNLISKNIIKSLLKKYKIRASKRLGQNFLIDKRTLKKFIKTVNPQPDDIILEIGPGIGTITEELAQRAKRVIAVEKDPKMCEIFEETLKNFQNVQIIQKDILKYPISSIQYPISNYKVAGNLPFYITAPVIRKFLEDKNPPKEIILMVQKEVAQRICSSAPKMNILAVSVQFYAKPEIILYVSKKSFFPCPKVDSAIIRISQIRTNLPLIDTNIFFRIVKAGFSQPRKQLVNNLSKGLALSFPNGLKLKKSSTFQRKVEDKEKIKSWLLKNNISPNQRAESLFISDWIKLTKTCELISC